MCECIWRAIDIYLSICSQSISIHFSMQTTLLTLSQQIMSGGDRGLKANQQFRSIISEVRNLNDCLQILSHSDNYLFVYCTNMLKLIQFGQFSLISQTKSQENVLDLLDSANSLKAKIYGQIISAMLQFLNNPNKPRHILKSIRDLTAICLKVLFEDSTFVPFLQKTINYFVPSYVLLQSFNTPTDSDLHFIQPRYGLDAVNFGRYITLVQIFNSMFEYLTIQTPNKTYYEYRRCIYVFRNSYLAYFLHFSVQHIKILFQFYDNSPALNQLMMSTIQLLQHIFMYQFTLSLHQYQLDEDNGDNISGAATGDIYFPNFFRHVICDIGFMQNIYRYYLMLVQNQIYFQDKRDQLNGILRIIGRACCSSQYAYKSDEEKQRSRQFFIQLIGAVCQNYRYNDSYYVMTILDILYKMVTMYDFYFSANRATIIEYALNFIYRIMQEFQIKIQEGKKSPFAKAFEIVSICLEHDKDKSQNEEGGKTKAMAQEIMAKSFQRFLSPQAMKMMDQFGYNNPQQIGCFTQLFEYIGSIFQLNLAHNLAFFQSIDISKLNPGSTTIWLHLCSQLLPKTSADIDQSKIILYYYQLASNGDSLASLRYIRTMTQEIMADFNQGEPSTYLWTHISQISQVGFKTFILAIINICIRNFSSQNNEIIDYSLELFKIIYIILKRNEHKTFEQFYVIVQKLLGDIEGTVFANPKYYYKRRQFFNVISVIWINSDTVSYTYTIYKRITSKLQTGTPQAFFQYLNDITGLLEPLDLHQAFQVLTELAIDDLNTLFNMHFTDQNRIVYFFNDQYFMKIFCKLVHALISDINRKLFFETHTRIPLKIQALIAPVLKILAQGGFDYPKNFAVVLEKTVTLNPLQELICFGPIVKNLKELAPESFQKLVRVYFEHIDRVGDIFWMFQLIENNVDYMVSWWEEAMIRNLVPKVSFAVIAQSRFWTTNRQKETFAKLLFEVGHYNKDYWNVPDNQGERAFVEDFSKVYT